MAARLDLTIEKGSTFERVFTWKTKDPVTGNLTVVDLSGYTARAMMREDYDSAQPFISLSTDDSSIVIDLNTNEVRLTIPANITTGIQVDRGYWDLEMVSGVTVIRLLEGKVKIKPEVTR